ncbi:MAG: glycosyltransferase family 2 protein, partial [Acidimicrobiales bacterium]
MAVVVTHDAGPWFEEALAGLAAQDYPNLSVLVIDAGSEEEALPRVATVLPGAYVRRIPANPGFGAAANEVLELVDGASFYALCHDDVHLEADAIRTMVEEAFRSNAGVVGPKVVSWDAPGALLQVGLSADKTGVASPLVEREELDQEQHDAVRDVFTIPGGCTLVRADLFEVLHGYDPAITFLGEDLDLCWRAQIAGARVVVAPGARARHREALPARRRVDDRRQLLARHRLRTVLICYSPFHLARILPWVAVLTIIEAAHAVVTGHTSQARDVLGAWSWNLRRLSGVRERRRLVRTSRRLPDSEVRRLQVRGSARVNAYVRGDLGGAAQVRSVAGLSRELTTSLAAPSRRPAVLTWVAVAVVLLIGTRDLLGEQLPAIGSLVPLSGPVELFRSWGSGFRDAGLGAVAPSPTAFGLLGLAGLAAFGQMGALQQLLVLGMLPLGLVGMWRLTRPLGSSRGRAAGLIVYAAVPLPYDALAEGSWPTLMLYGASPWILGQLLSASGEEPFAPGGGHRRPLWHAVLSLGLIVAVLAAFVPLVALAVPMLALALVVGATVAGRPGGGLRVVAVAGGASVVAAVVHVPWSIDLLLPGSTWWGLGGIAALAPDRVAMTELLRFGSGTDATSRLGWATVVAAALPLLIGKEWRFSLAVRVWFVALACWGLAYADGSGLLPVPLPAVSLLLVPGAAGLAFAAALGLVAFERDLRGYRFGWRQVASIVAGAAVVAGALPTVLAAVNGRWSVPAADFSATLSFTEVAEAATEGDYRILWIGHPASLPVGGQRLDDGLAYALTSSSSPDITDRWSIPEPGATALAAEALELAAAGRTDRLGRLLAPLGVRYLALPASAAPERAHAAARPLPEGVLATTSRQLDLEVVDVDPA